MRPSSKECSPRTSSHAGLSLLLLPMALAACGGNPGDGRESWGDKQEWSILQGLEVETRNQTLTQPTIRWVADYELLGVPREGDSRPVWIMLTPRHPPFYKQMPEGEFELSEGILNDLVRRRAVISTVEEALRSHVHVAKR